MSENEKAPLVVASTQEVKQELLTAEPLPQSVEQLMEQQATELVSSLMSADLTHIETQHLSVGKLEDIGQNEQQQAVKQIALLKQPIATLSRRAQDGGEVANALIDLKVTVESLDPAQIDFEPGWFSRLLGHIPFVGTSVKRYAMKFESAQTVIESVIRSLEMGRDQLLRDNVTLKEDQKQLWETEKQLEGTLKFASIVDQKLEAQSQQLKTQNAEQAKIVDEYMLFPVRQRIIDLQQQVVVSQQTVVASEIIIRNNKELVRGVNRALNVTVTALQNATTIAMALAHQEKVLQKIDKVNETTSKLIADSARRLKTQGTAIHKGAASAQIDVQALKSALADIKTALEDISTFRQKALPTMATVVSDLDHLIKESAEPLKRISNESTKNQNEENS